jgi:hypothetical protein
MILGNVWSLPKRNEKKTLTLYEHNDFCSVQQKYGFELNTVQNLNTPEGGKHSTLEERNQRTST